MYDEEEATIASVCYSRGHLTFWDGKECMYEDGKIFDDSRICAECNIPHVPWGPDACIGYKPGVMSMCCGHGRRMGTVYKITNRIGSGNG